MLTEPPAALDDDVMPPSMSTFPPAPEDTVEPARRTMLLPPPELDVPTTTLIAPVLPPLAVPVTNNRPPLFPLWAAPELSVREPVDPTEFAAPDCSKTLPLPELRLNPLATVTDPPTPTYADPACTRTSPPGEAGTTEVVEPALKSIAPPLPDDPTPTLKLMDPPRP